MTTSSLSRQSLHADAAHRIFAGASGLVSARARARAPGFLAGAAAFCFFLPYPALNVGSTSAIQIGNVLALLACAPILWTAWRRWPMHILPLILLPLLISAVKVALAGDGDLDLSIKEIVVWITAGTALLAVQIWAPRFAPQILTGIAIATLLHAAIGLWQFYSFSSGQFPIPWLYVNQSFLSIQDNADHLAKFNQRPFGLFPEPSAMSSSLAPFVFFWIAQLCGLVRLRRRPEPWQLNLFAAAGVAGLFLIILSQSGHAATTLAAVLVVGLIWLLRSRATLRTYLTLVCLLGVVLPLLLWFASSSLSARLDEQGEMTNSSWEERSASLVIGFNHLTQGGAATLLFGLGPGMSAPILWSSARIDAVFSILLVFIYETGLVGLIAVAWIGRYLAIQWKSVRYDVVFAAFFLLWLVGVTVTTSYTQLLPVWVALGWLTIWPALCEPAAPLFARHEPVFAASAA